MKTLIQFNYAIALVLSLTVYASTTMAEQRHEWNDIDVIRQNTEAAPCCSSLL